MAPQITCFIKGGTAFHTLLFVDHSVQFYMNAFYQSCMFCNGRVSVYCANYLMVFTGETRVEHSS